MTTTVDELHRELAFADHVEQLKSVKGIWRQLVALQRAAQKDARQLSRYRTFLETAIARNKAIQGEPLTEEQAIEAVLDVQQRYDTLRAERVPMMRNRGRELEAWMDKWKAPVVAQLAEAGRAAFDDPTTATIKRLHDAVEAYFKAYDTP